MRSEAALNKLLLSLFSAEELRTYLLMEVGKEVVSDLPERGVSHTQLVSEAVGVLSRRGLIDRDFFEHLREHRNNRLDDIKTVRDQCLKGASLDRGEIWADRYRLESACGQGGFGLVWKAVDAETNAVVALKILQETFAHDRQIRVYFYRGAEELNRLNHPAIVRVRSGIEQEGDRYFYVMDFIDGVSLDALVGKQPTETLFNYIWQIGEALVYLHDRKIVHRDIKPDNILVNSKKQATLIDFDIVTGDTYTATTTFAPGTQIYAPPEVKDLDKKTAAYDVFSLARTVEHVIRGRRPRASDTIDSLETSEAVKGVLRAALRALPSERTQSVKIFCEDLRLALMPPVLAPQHPARYLVASPVVQMKPTETPASFVPPAVRLVSRVNHRRKIISLIVGALLLTFGIAVYVIFDNSEFTAGEAITPPSLRPQARDRQPTSVDDRPSAKKDERTGEQIVAWWCLCYIRSTEQGTVGGSKPVTNCRKSLSECASLRKRTYSGFEEIIQGSLTHNCQTLKEKVGHPGDVLGGREGWEQSERDGNWYYENGPCLLNVEASVLEKESLGGLAIGLLSRDVRNLFGPPEEERANGPNSKDWMYSKKSLTVTMSVKRKSVIGFAIGLGSELATAKGIGIGASREYVSNLYKTDKTQSGALAETPSRFVLGTVNEGVSFFFDASGKVDGIHFISNPK